MSNPLLSDRDVAFLLYDVHDAAALAALPAFADHGSETFDLFLGSARRLAREVLFPAYKPMDEAPARFEDGRIRTHPAMRAIYPQLVELGMLDATRPQEMGGQQLPLTVYVAAAAYLMAANGSAFGFAGLTSGAAHLIEAFGSEALRERFLLPMVEGRWTGTMALTEPQAGSSLGDVQTKATPADDGSFRITGGKIFISGGDADFVENVVHLTLARIEGAPAGTKGLSLFAVPRLRPEGDGLVDNDVHVTGAIHKVGWRGLPSVVLSYGERGDCRGWLLGAPGAGLKMMFQMMNEARILVGLNAVATASVAYRESLAYAEARQQGRAPTERNQAAPQVPIVAHADVRRMLLRQKAIVEGGLSLLLYTSKQADLAAHGRTAEERERARLLLDLLTPVAKSFPAERGFEANALALQIHGGYGYSSEYLPEAWLRDQKLNSIHEGTTGIQSLDLLGRKVMAQGGEALRILAEEVAKGAAAAREAGVDPSWCDALEEAVGRVGALTLELGAAGLQGEVERMLLHSADYLELFSIVVVAWQWIAQAAAAKRTPGDPFCEGKLRAAQYWIRTELPRVEQLAALCASGESSYGEMQPGWF